MCLVKRIKNCVCTLLRLNQLFLHRHMQEKKNQIRGEKVKNRTIKDVI